MLLLLLLLLLLLVFRKNDKSDYKDSARPANGVDSRVTSETDSSFGISMGNATKSPPPISPFPFSG
jgi:hypothetical protein